MDIPGITITEANGQVFFHFQPIPGRQALEPSALNAMLDDSPYRDYERNAEAISLAANDCAKQPEPFFVLAACRRDASYQVQIAQDDSQASLSITRAHGGKPATLEMALLALHNAGVLFGIDMALLSDLCAQGAADAVCVAQATPAQDGEDARFTSLIPDSVDRAPRLDEFGRIDYREHGGILMVSARQPLMRRTPPTPGVDGHTVRGRVLSAHAGQDLPFTSPLPGAVTDPQDPNLLVAEAAGQPVKVPRGITVEPVLHVSEVNMALGNIHFDGTVEVDGDVGPGMKVQASGDIVVKGTVDGGLLDAGGNVHVSFGIIAHARVNAGAAVHGRFAENSTLNAGTLIALQDAALQCQMVSLNQIIVGDKSGRRGRLVGGSASAMMLLHVPTLGAVKGGLTQVSAGHNPKLQAQLQALEARIAEEATQEVKLHKLTDQISAAHDPRGLLPKVKASWHQALQLWSKSLAERSKLKEELAIMHRARVEIGLCAEGSVDLHLGDKTVHIRRELGPGTIALDEDDRVVHHGPGGCDTVL